MRKCKKIAKKINAKKKRVNIRSHNLWNLAAERLRWMGFDNRLVIDCFTNVATYMVIFLQMIDSEVRNMNLLHYIRVHFQKWISWVFGSPRTSCTTSGWPVRPQEKSGSLIQAYMPFESSEVSSNQPDGVRKSSVQTFLGQFVLVFHKY